MCSFPPRRYQALQTKPVLGEATMAAVSELVRTGIVELRSNVGSFYAKPSLWERLYLVWTFRNFHALPKEVLNPRQRRLAEKLCQSVDFTVRGPIIRFPIIGVIENAAPAPVAKTQAFPAASNLVEMTATKAEFEVPRAVASGEISLRTANPAQNQPFMGTLARYGTNVVDLPSAKEEPAQASRDAETDLAVSDPDTATPRTRGTLRLVLVAGCSMAALGLFVYSRGARPAPAAEATPTVSAIHQAAVPSPLPTQPETVLPSSSSPAKRPAKNPALKPPLQLAAAQHQESQPSSPIIRVLPAFPASDSTTPVSPVAAGAAPAPIAPAPTASVPARPERLHVAAAPESGFKYPVAGNPSLTGKVSLKAVIGQDGAVREVDVLSGNRALAGAAARAVKRWRYHPYELNGHAVEAETQVTFNFLGDDVVSISFSR